MYIFNVNILSYEEEKPVPKRKWEYFRLKQKGVSTDQVSLLYGKLKNGHFAIHMLHLVYFHC